MPIAEVALEAFLTYLMPRFTIDDAISRKFGIGTAYTLFAVLSMGINILFQELSLLVYTAHYALYVSILAGTLAGLVVKYLLDKRYIFRYRTFSMLENGKTFIMYSLMGVATTLVFWGFELSFEFLFRSKAMRYTGAVIGLAIGYYLKYHLDKRFVFNT